MSFCRWSTDDFRCDLYCYESNSGFETLVACNRYVCKEPIPRRIDYSLTDKKIQARWFARQEKVMSLIHEAALIPIGLAYDGQSFCNETLEGFLVTLKMLKKAGYKFPAGVIRYMKEAIKEPTP